MKLPWCTAVAACIVVVVASSSFAGQVKLEIRDGLVTLEARDATLREIFSEWARVGKTRIVNAESVPGGPMTMQLIGVPERQALETLLRSAAGFMAAPRAIPQASASMYDRIMLMPGMRPAAIPTSVASAPSGQPQSPWTRDRYSPPTVVTDDEDEAVPNAQMPSPGALGAPPIGLLTGLAPSNEAGMASPNGPPATQGNPYNPYQLVNPNVPSTGASPGPVPSMPQSAPRPGTLTPPPPPIKGPGGI
ncbi:MAG TPA: hypothetical protein VF332_05110 [Vicinamibacterales bacterium]